ncbi:MAG: hypothetical protein DMF45_13125 [Verrucomicrobia bacterium]|nr:MAG: hypothetical protein DMF45_13125 [Verrucomicrobiota bacterium]
MKKIPFKPTSESQHRKCRCDLFNGFIKMKSGRQSNRGACGGSLHHTTAGAWNCLSISRFLSKTKIARERLMWSEVCRSAAHVSDSALPAGDGDKILPEINA